MQTLVWSGRSARPAGCAKPAEAQEPTRRPLSLPQPPEKIIPVTAKKRRPQGQQLELEPLDSFTTGGSPRRLGGPRAEETFWDLSNRLRHRKIQRSPIAAIWLPTLVALGLLDKPCRKLRKSRLLSSTPESRLCPLHIPPMLEQSRACTVS